MKTRILMVSIGLFVAACSSDNNPPPPPQNQAPTIAQVSDQSVEANQSSAPIAVNITDDQPATDQLQLTAFSNDEMLVPAAAIVVSGSGMSREIVITPTAALTGSTLITLTATDSDGASATTSFTLNVVRESVSYAQFLRDVFSAGENAIPSDVNSREFVQDAVDDEFSDLL